MRQLAGFTILAFLFVSSISFAAEKQTERKSGKPNIVLIMCDDMGFSDIGCYGGEVETPHIDRLAHEGLRFKQFYNNAKCTTTRASLITGLYPRRNGGLLKANMVTIADVLKPAGYDTILSGKWHLGNREPNRPSDRGFDRYFGLLDGCCNFFDPAQPDPKFKGSRVRFVAKDDVRITEFPDDFYMTDAISDYAVEQIDVSLKNQKPFFLHVCYTAPHYPLHAKPQDIAKYRNRYLKGWEKLRDERYQRQLKMGLVDPQWKLPKLEVTTWEKTENHEWNDLRMAVYAAMIDSMDQGIGKILTKLETEKILDNTVVMFLSDNGGCAETPGGNNTSYIPGPKEFYTHCGPGWAFAQNTPFRRYKSETHEGGISTPLIIRWPGVVKADTWTNQVAHIIDLLPTCAEIGGATYPNQHNGEKVIPLEGKTLLPVFKGKTRDSHDALYFEWAGNRAVRMGDWKIVWNKKGKTWELYNISADRTETTDLSENHPERVEKMSRLWYDWAAKTGLKAKPPKTTAGE